MKSSRRTQEERTATTRAALIEAGRKLFAEHGFAGVGTESLVRAAGISRGALYHQFGDKTELFAEVLAVVEADITEGLVAAMPMDGNVSLVVVMTRALEAWLDACQTPEVQRIVLVDGPSVLGWARWRAICQSNVLGLIESVLTRAQAEGELLPLPVRPLSHLLLAVADEAAMYLHSADDQAKAREEIVQIVDTLVRGLVAPAHDR